VEGLVYFLLLATILNISEYDFCNTLYHMGFTQDDKCEKILYEFYTQEKYNLYRTLISEYISLLHFKSMEWRFEGKISNFLVEWKKSVGEDYKVNKKKAQTLDRAVWGLSPSQVIEFSIMYLGMYEMGSLPMQGVIFEVLFMKDSKGKHR
jgi:hypothetical protein